MMKHEAKFVRDADLIMVKAVLGGPRGSTFGRFILDTGAAMSTMTPEIADLLGYSARDGKCRTRVRSAVGEEAGYTLRVAQFTALELTVHDLDMHVFDLGDDSIDGLIGLNFLNALNYEVRSAEQRILIEKILH